MKFNHSIFLLALQLVKRCWTQRRINCAGDIASNEAFESDHVTAVINITELREIALTSDGKSLWIPDMSKIVAQQDFTYTTSTASRAFKLNTCYLRVYCDAKAFLNFGDNPVATVGSVPIASDSPEFFAVKPGSKIAAYDGTS